ncbi:GNAT family acetyltransferase [Fusobacterium pseudoperiodonticum]|uniref:GNAT family acetyltransferase n=1 Tax=Fusobacterium pseudoperiodonticum TaxID=2663009 RepID=UPI000C1BE80C|nr:GNAT family acetyltransferase [Fusobacterium pseudoperiodonticum]ATV57289.1 GNAT family acetyltransferase [Fusobacterium pseudoperiodonticum]
MEVKNENLKECLTNLDYETIKNLIKNSKNDSEKNFYIDLLNLILQYQQEEVVRKGVF